MIYDFRTRVIDGHRQEIRETGPSYDLMVIVERVRIFWGYTLWRRTECLRGVRSPEWGLADAMHYADLAFEDAVVAEKASREQRAEAMT